MSESTSRFLDATRWAAAFAVLLCHACGLMLVNWTDTTDSALPLRMIFCLEDGGHVAVIVFFVVSGFLVGGREIRRIADGARFDVARYSIQRISRIYTVLCPALAATWVLDRIGRAFFNGSGLYTKSNAERFISLYFNIEHQDSLKAFVGNLFMLQTIKVSPFGSNGPLWSLAYEWWYYILLMLALIFASRERRLHWRLAALAACLVGLVVLPRWISLWFVFWLLGAAVALLDKSWRGIAFPRAFAVMLAGFALALYGSVRLHAFGDMGADTRMALEWSDDLVSALAFSFALLSAKNATVRAHHILHHRLADFSYTLYLTHFPALLLAGAILHDVFGVELAQSPSFWRALLIAALIIVIGAYGWFFAFLTERHTSAVRRILGIALSRAQFGFGMPLRQKT